MAKILVNKIKCNKCSDVIVSTHRHDFKFCKCGAVAVDGGTDYLRRGGKREDWEELSEYENLCRTDMNQSKTLAVISDIHGNYKALEVFLEYISTLHVDGIICLGDYVTDSPYPERIMALIRQMQAKYQCYMVRGNRENYMIDNQYNEQGWKPSSASGCFYYTAKHLSYDDLAFFASMPEELLVSIEGCPELFICHGTPGEVRGNVDLTPGLKEKALAKIKGKYLLGGHSHVQEIYRSQGKMYLNPGALGIALDGVGRHVHFAMLRAQVGTWEAELLSIPYDAEAFLRDFAESGLDELGFVLNRAVKKSILTGVNYVLKAVTLAEQETGCTPNQVSEDVWEKIASRLDL